MTYTHKITGQQISEHDYAILPTSVKPDWTPTFSAEDEWTDSADTEEF